MRGYVYILTNLAIPDLVKVGFSSRDPAERAAELNGTSAPSPFHVHYEALVDDPNAVERMLHDVLRSERHRTDREFFRLTPSEAVHRVRTSLEEYGCKLHFEPRSTFRCGACARWSFAEHCNCRGLLIDVAALDRKGLRKLCDGLATYSPAVAGWLGNARECHSNLTDGKYSVSLMASSLAIHALTHFGTKFAMPMMLVAAHLDCVNCQKLLSMDALEPREKYFWERLWFSNPNAQEKSSYWTQKSYEVLVSAVGEDAARETEALALQWIANHRASGQTNATPTTVQSV